VTLKLILICKFFIRFVNFSHAVSQKQSLTFDLGRKTAFFSKQIASFTYQVYVFGDHITKCDSIEVSLKRKFIPMHIVRIK